MPDAVALTASDPTIRARGKRGPWAEIAGATIAITAGNRTTFTLTADATLPLTGLTVELLIGVPVPIGTTPGTPAFTVTLTVSSATTAAGSLTPAQTATLTAAGYKYAVTVAGQLVTHGKVRLTGDTPAVETERHYLQFDGVGDIGIADAVFGGVTNRWTIAVKVAGTLSTDGRTYISTGGPSGLSVLYYDKIYRSTATARFSALSRTATDGFVAIRAPTASSDTKSVIAWSVTSTASGTAYYRLIQGGAVVSTNNQTQSTTQDKPDHITIGALSRDDLVTHDLFGDPKFISAVLVAGVVPDAELQAWDNATTAVGNITGIDHYWVASDISGASIPARVGTVALALTGPAVGDLVEL